MAKYDRSLNESNLHHATDKLFIALDNQTPGTDEYAAIQKQIIKFYNVRQEDTKVNSSRRLSPDTIATVAANLAGIALIVKYEQTAVLTSKAINFIKQIAR